MLNLLSDFEWWRTRRGRHVLGQGLVAVTEVPEDRRPYRPLADYPGLYLNFCFLDPSERPSVTKREIHTIHGFVHRYGLLTQDLSHPDRLAESEELWADQILKMRRAVTLVQALRQEQTSIVEGIVKEWEASPEAVGVWVPRLPMLSRLLTMAEAAPGAVSQALAARALRLLAGELTSTLFGVGESGGAIPSTLSAAGAALHAHTSLILELRWDQASAKPIVGFLPSNLLQALWGQVAQSLAFDQSYTQCAVCSSWMPRRAEGTSIESRYCSTVCRMKAYSDRRRSARDLYREGQTVAEIAGRLGTDAETVSRWVGANLGRKGEEIDRGPE